MAARTWVKARKKQIPRPAGLGMTTVRVAPGYARLVVFTRFDNVELRA